MTDDDFDAPPKRRAPSVPIPKVMLPDKPPEYARPDPVEPGVFVCAQHRAPDGFWSTPTGWIAQKPNTPVDEAFAYAVVNIVGGDTGRFVMAHYDYGALVKWCQGKVSGDWRKDYAIRPCNLLVLRQDAPVPPGYAPPLNSRR